MMKSAEWTPAFAHHLYQTIADQRVYVTSLGKCSQVDARPLPNSVFRAYLDQMYAEIVALQPAAIVTFGNQVSSIFLQKKISVSQYAGIEHEIALIQGQSFLVYPTYYPVGLGMRNIDKAIERLHGIKSL
jgi:uracil-DNA glycosylase